MIRSADGPKGYAFVKFKKVDGAERALRLNGTKLDNRVIAITISDPNMHKNKREDHKMTGKIDKFANFIPRSALGRFKPRSILKSTGDAETGHPKGQEEPIKRKTQDDFRRMLSNK